MLERNLKQLTGRCVVLVKLLLWVLLPGPHAGAQEPAVPLRILTQPTLGQPVPLQGFFFLSVAAEGTGTLRYQWQLNGVNLPGETNVSLFREHFTVADAGVYRVVVSDDLRSILSEPSGVEPQIDQSPFSDDFGGLGGTGLGFLEGTSGTGAGNNLLATAEPGEPTHGGLPGAASVWVAWRPEVAGIATLNTTGSDFDTVLAVYIAPTGAASQLALLQPVAANDDGPLPPASEVQFTVAPGIVYYVAVDGVQGRQRGGRGRIALSWSVEVTVQSAPLILQQPAPVTGEPGEPAGFQVQFEPDPVSEITEVQWFRGGIPMPGANSLLLNFQQITEFDVWPYYAVITQVYPDGSRRVIQTEVVDIQLSLQEEGTAVVVRAYDKLARLLVELTLDPAPAAARAGRIRPHGLTRGTSGTQVFSTLDASRDEGEPIHCNVPGGSSQWYAILADADGVIEVDTAGSVVSATEGPLDTVLAIYYDEGTGLGLYDGLRTVACNNDISPADRTSAVSFCARQGTVYLIAVDGVGGAKGRVKLNYRMRADDSQGLCAAPQILCPPVPDRVVVAAGGGITLSFTTDAPPPLTYQWSRDGTPLAGETGPTLALKNLPAGHAGVYGVKIANASGEDFRVISSVRVHSGAEPALGMQRQCDGTVRVLVAAPSGSRTVLEISDDLATWLPVVTNTAAAEPFGFVVNPAAQAGSRGFRARIQ